MNIPLFATIKCTSLLLVCQLLSALPPGFVDEGVNRWSRVTDIESIPATERWPTTSLLVAQKTGELHMIEDADNKPRISTLVIDISERLCFNGERGLQSVQVHPRFHTNRFVYLYYTFKGDTNCEQSRTIGPVNRCSRFIMRSNNTLDEASEKVLFQTTPLPKQMHNGGDMVFGNDGYLYIATGDGGMSKASRISQDNSDLLGTLVRLKDDGGIPPDNPFVAEGERCAMTGAAADRKSPCQEIYATGLRNPFKIATDPNVASTRLYINDVGGRTWEEANLAGDGFAGANYGWPEREGPCNGFGNAGDNIKGCFSDPQYQDPDHFYMHRDPSGQGGGAIVGGAFVPNGFWPSEFDDSYLFADFVFGDIYQLLPGKGCSDCGASNTPVSRFENNTFHSFESTSALHFAPYKDTIALYYGSQRLSPFTVRRIVYVGGRNTSPIARIETSTLVAGVGEKVWFDGRNSTDADHDPLSYSWNFGDGSSSVGRMKSHTYDEVGVFAPTLTVRDGNGGQHTATILLTVGSPPTVKMIEPVAGTDFSVGERLLLDGVAMDRKGRRLPPSSLQWEVRKHHGTHWHPFLSPKKGNHVLLLPAPSPEDFLAATNSHLEILLIATDADGLSTTVSRIIQPKTVLIDFETKPPGVELSVDGFRIRTPQRVVSWANHTMQVAAHNDAERTFLLWSDGGAKEHAVVAKGRSSGVPMKYVATFHTKSYWEKILDFLTFATRRSEKTSIRTAPAS